MSRTRTTPLPDLVTQALIRLGADIDMARRRRGLTQARVAAAAGITLPSLRAIERGSATTSIGLYFTVLWALGLESEFVDLAASGRDRVGLTLDAARAPKRVRSPVSGVDDDF